MFSHNDFVNNQIESERSNAALLGIDFNIDDEIKATRINDYFGTLYNQGDYDTLQNLNTEFGDPENPLEFLITRGAAVDTAADGEGAADTGSNTRGQSELPSLC